MKRSSARQLEFSYPAEEAPVAVSPISPDLAGSSEATSPTLTAPDFETYGVAYAATARLAGRLNASAITQQEHDRLLSERKRLLDKKLGGTITREESNKLEYVRWSLDRIEDAKHGQALDVLASHVSTYERFLADLEALSTQLKGHQRASKKR